MNQNSANSLLKILEEPPKDSILILTTSKINSLLPTIIGRCQKIRVDNIDKELVRKYLKESEDNLTEEETEFYSELSEGSITKCNEILGKNFPELRDKVLDVLTYIITDQNLKLGNEIDLIIGKKDKERIKQFLVLMEIWFRDLIIKSGGNDKLIINKDKSERIKRFDENFYSDNYKIISKIEEAIRDVDGNIFPDLILYNLAFSLKSLIKRKD